MNTAKQKLINLVSVIEETKIIDYIYTFIGLKVYGKIKLPDDITEDLRQLWENSMLSSDDKQEEKEPILEEKQIAACRISIMRKLYDVESTDILNYISIIIDDIYKEWEQMKGEKV